MLHWTILPASLMCLLVEGYIEDGLIYIYGTCYWFEPYLEFKDYLRQFNPPVTVVSLENCALACYRTDNCTGFEIATSGAYCAPWFNYACYKPISPNWHPVESFPTYSLDFSTIQSLVAIEAGKTASTPNEEIIFATKVMNITRVRELASLGNPRYGDGTNNTALHWAAMNGFQEIALVLINAGWDLNQFNMYHKTPVYYAVYYGLAELVEFFLSFSDVDIEYSVEDWGRYPIHEAAAQELSLYHLDILTTTVENDYTKILKILLDYGANTKVQDNAGLTPLHWATGRSDSWSIKLLLERGAKFNISDLHNETALDIARNKENVIILKLYCAAQFSKCITCDDKVHECVACQVSYDLLDGVCIPKVAMTRVIINNSYKILILVFDTLWILVSLILMGYVNKHKIKPLIKASSPEFILASLLAGVILAVASTTFVIEDSEGLYVCILRFILTLTGTTLLFASLLGKTWRLYKIFIGNLRMKPVIMTNRKLAMNSSLMFMPVLLIFVWYLWDINENGLVLKAYSSGSRYQEYCPASYANDIGILVMYIYALALAVLSFVAREIPNDFNEIVHVIYLDFFWMMITGFAVGMWLLAGDTPSNRGMIGGIYLAVVSLVANVALVGPKVLLIYYGDADRRITISNKSSMKRGTNQILTMCNNTSNIGWKGFKQEGDSNTPL